MNTKCESVNSETVSHTPGPWQRLLAYEAKEKRPPYNVWNIVGNTDADERRHSMVATTITDDQDARLIAAAPDLLLALEKCEQVIGMARLQGKLDDSALSPVNDALVSARRAIDKTR